MEGLLLLALLLLWGLFSSVSTSTEGELCRAWDHGLDPPLGSFQCPTRLDGTDAKFCCGTCGAPYCCSSGEARLDQARCFVPGLPEAKAAPPLRRPTPPSLMDVWLVGSFWFSMLALALMACHCMCYYDEVRDWLKCRWRTRREETEPTDLDDLRRLPGPGVPAVARMQAVSLSVSVSPPYESCLCPDPLPSDPPPSYSSLDLTDSGAGLLCHSNEDAPQVTFAPSVSRRVPSCSVEPGSKTETEL